jgi:lysozyme family protein
MKYGRPAILDDLCVVHIWHEISKTNYKQLEENKNIYNHILKENGIKNFHTGRILYNESDVIEFEV